MHNTVLLSCISLSPESSYVVVLVSIVQILGGNTAYQRITYERRNNQFFGPSFSYGILHFTCTCVYDTVHIDRAMIHGQCLF